MPRSPDLREGVMRLDTGVALAGVSKDRMRVFVENHLQSLVREAEGNNTINVALGVRTLSFMRCAPAEPVGQMHLFRLINQPA